MPVQLVDATPSRREGSLQKTVFSYGSERCRDGPTQKADLRGSWKAELSLHEIGHSVRKEPEIIHLEEVLQ